MKKESSPPIEERGRGYYKCSKCKQPKKGIVIWSSKKFPSGHKCIIDENEKEIITQHQQQQQQNPHHHNNNQVPAQQQPPQKEDNTQLDVLFERIRRLESENYHLKTRLHPDFNLDPYEEEFELLRYIDYRLDM